ncbi:signal recognition particle protein [Natranaerobius thermophilus]|uniref:Signal recognition particle protein n=1 Tax=Natranaerobius thermophilus (strain ATCC BAA-1301 / DSM 18059 / JW/NM-WN-LF) TaxID=457570 RepID=B2A2N6_NATTJ|nr:signal recognition particle protein [Natranaerobius thermophilus]ACB84951.1 signal recognition particle subunit FFH/SRP54 (srp54) [Natranaerobius thermophilus JW/NM-WN-LF]
MLQRLSEKLQDTFGKLTGKGKVNEKDVKEAMREVRLALLEADVNYKVVKEFVNNVKERAVGEEVLESLTPGQQVIKIVRDELTQLMGGEVSEVNFSDQPPTVIMLSGLQGTGKTTASAKLAKKFKKDGKNPLMVACDTQRPAAIKQLQVLGEQTDIPVFSMGDKQHPADIAKGAVEHAKKNQMDVVILDTAGRLHIDEDLMTELREVESSVEPHEILLVVDAMTGQDAVNVAERFDQDLDLSGIVMTKLDGDTRGGAALSVKKVTGKPIKFIGTGEKVDELEVFHPDRLASRILGMGDVMSLIEKAETSMDQKKAQELEKKIKSQSFTFEDFLEQLQQLKSMGPLDQIMDMMPGMAGNKKMKNFSVDEQELVKIEAIIQSMTQEERVKPEVINSSRKKRIAKGSGTRVQDVNKLLKQFEQMKKMMKQMGKMGKKKMPGKMGNNLPFM